MKRLAAAALALAIAAPARVNAEAEAPRPPAGPDGWLHDLVRDVRAKIDAAIVARPPKLVPPKKVDIHWKLAKLGSLDLGAPLIAMTGADLDGDGKGELYAVTTRDVIALGVRNKRLEEIGRVAFAGEAAVPMPRDVVGSVSVETGAIVASVSSFAKSLHVWWNDKTLVGSPGKPGFAMCPGEVVQLVPGRNYFGDATNQHYGARCRSGLVEPDGHPIRVRAQLTLANHLEIAVERCAAANLGCQPARKHDYGAAGTAFDIADVDRDGNPELIYTGMGAPGDPDLIKVVTLGDDEKRHAKLRKSFTAGGVAGVAVSDLDGNGVQDVAFALRIVGATRVDLWRIE
ncbi:MAG TPA: hypothetical protein VFV99_26255 [Kofleriaceae bacterium]|nr:hypothetical protein [Kofleriaceae bacterium]